MAAQICELVLLCLLCVLSSIKYNFSGTPENFARHLRLANIVFGWFGPVCDTKSFGG